MERWVQTLVPAQRMLHSSAFRESSYETFYFPAQLYATGYGAGGRLGIGGTESVSTPTLLESIQHVFIRKVAVNSGGKHCLALSSEGEVYSWGEAEDGKLGHGNRRSRPNLINLVKHTMSAQSLVSITPKSENHVHGFILISTNLLLALAPATVHVLLIP